MDIASYEKDLLQSVVSSILDHGGREILSAIILSGSFGRDEPTYTVNDDGSFTLKSDVEIALVVSGNHNTKHLIQTVSQEFPEELNLMPISEKRIRKIQNFNYSFGTPRYKTLFTYDLFNGSRTIWGRDFLSGNAVSLADLDAYEAKRLVANRIGELCYISNPASPREDSGSVIQWKGKLVLALASAWLILNQDYVSSYHGQFEKLKAQKEAIDKDLGKDFFAEYERVFHYLRDHEQSYEVPDELLRSFVKNLVPILRSKGIARPKVNSASRIAKYSIKYLKAGMKFGLVNFEDRILQALIVQYYEDCPDIFQTADLWHKVLY